MKSMMKFTSLMIVSLLFFGLIASDVLAQSTTLYKVQVASHKNPSLIDFQQLSPLGNVLTEDAGNGLTRIIVGYFTTKASAENAAAQTRQLGHSDAYVRVHKPNQTVYNTTNSSYVANNTPPSSKVPSSGNRYNSDPYTTAPSSGSSSSSTAANTATNSGNTTKTTVATTTGDTTPSTADKLKELKKNTLDAPASSTVVTTTTATTREKIVPPSSTSTYNAPSSTVASNTNTTVKTTTVPTITTGTTVIYEQQQPVPAAANSGTYNQQQTAPVAANSGAYNQQKATQASASGTYTTTTTGSNTAASSTTAYNTAIPIPAGQLGPNEAYMIDLGAYPDPSRIPDLGIANQLGVLHQKTTNSGTVFYLGEFSDGSQAQDAVRILRTQPGLQGVLIRKLDRISLEENQMSPATIKGTGTGNVTTTSYPTTTTQPTSTTKATTTYPSSTSTTTYPSSTSTTTYPSTTTPVYTPTPAPAPTYPTAPTTAPSTVPNTADRLNQLKKNTIYTPAPATVPAPVYTPVPATVPTYKPAPATVPNTGDRLKQLKSNTIQTPAPATVPAPVYTPVPATVPTYKPAPATVPNTGDRLKQLKSNTIGTPPPAPIYTPVPVPAPPPIYVPAPATVPNTGDRLKQLKKNTIGNSTSSTTSTYSQQPITTPPPPAKAVTFSSLNSYFSTSKFDIFNVEGFDPYAQVGNSNNDKLKGKIIPKHLIPLVDNTPNRDKTLDFYAIQQFEIAPNFHGYIVRTGKGAYDKDNSVYLYVFNKTKNKFIHKYNLSDVSNKNGVYSKLQSWIVDLSTDGVLDILSYRTEEYAKGGQTKKLQAKVWVEDEFLDAQIVDETKLKEKLGLE